MAILSLGPASLSLLSENIYNQASQRQKGISIKKGRIYKQRQIYHPMKHLFFFLLPIHQIIERMTYVQQLSLFMKNQQHMLISPETFHIVHRVEINIFLLSTITIAMLFLLRH